MNKEQNTLKRPAMKMIGHEELPTYSQFQTAADILKILGDANRIRIFWILCHCEECLINLSAMIDMSSPAISHHLKILKSYGLITSRREGKEMYYTVSKNSQTMLLHHTIEQMIEIACPEEVYEGGTTND